MSGKNPNLPVNGGYNTYIGARYIPVYDGIWDKTKAYEPLTLVYWEGRSYVSKTFVPSGTELTDTDYWGLASDFNVQVEQYRDEVQTAIEKFEDMYNEFSEGITDQQSSFEEKLNKDQADFEKEITDKEEKHVQDVLEKQNAFEGTITEQENQHIEDMNGKWEEYKSGVDQKVQEQTTQSVTDWLNEHVSDGSVVVDDTLSVEGAAADAKVVGDRTLIRRYWPDLYPEKNLDDAIKPGVGTVVAWSNGPNVSSDTGLLIVFSTSDNYIVQLLQETGDADHNTLWIRHKYYPTSATPWSKWWVVYTSNESSRVANSLCSPDIPNGATELADFDQTGVWVNTTSNDRPNNRNGVVINFKPTLNKNEYNVQFFVNTSIEPFEMYYRTQWYNDDSPDTWNEWQQIITDKGLTNTENNSVIRRFWPDLYPEKNLDDAIKPGVGTVVAWSNGPNVSSDTGLLIVFSTYDNYIVQLLQETGDADHNTLWIRHKYYPTSATPWSKWWVVYTSNESSRVANSLCSPDIPNGATELADFDQTGVWVNTTSNDRPNNRDGVVINFKPNLNKNEYNVQFFVNTSIEPFEMYYRTQWYNNGNTDTWNEWQQIITDKDIKNYLKVSDYKLYQTTGINVDGAMTQKAASDKFFSAKGDGAELDFNKHLKNGSAVIVGGTNGPGLNTGILLTFSDDTERNYCVQLFQNTGSKSAKNTYIRHRYYSDASTNDWSDWRLLLTNETNGYSYDIVSWGDSITRSGEPDNYTKTLADLLGTSSYMALGDSGGRSNDIAFRAGANPFRVSGSVNGDITHNEALDEWGKAIEMWKFDQYSDNSVNPITVNGHECTLKRKDASTYTIEGYTGEVLDYPTEVKVNGANIKGKLTVIFTGTNNSSEVDDIIKYTQQIIDGLLNNNYIVCGLYVGDDNDGISKTRDEKMHEAFKDHFLDLRKLMSEYGLNIAGLSPNEEDTGFPEKHATSYQLLDEEHLHPNTYGIKVLAKLMADFAIARGYWKKDF